MGRQPESRLVGKILNFLNANYPGYWQKIHGGPFQSRGIPDIIGCHRGRFIGIEVKLDYNEASELQVKNGKAIKKAKGLWMVAYSVEEVKQFMEVGFNAKRG